MLLLIVGKAQRVSNSGFYSHRFFKLFHIATRGVKGNEMAQRTQSVGNVVIQLRDCQRFVEVVVSPVSVAQSAIQQANPVVMVSYLVRFLQLYHFKCQVEHFQAVLVISCPEILPTAMTRRLNNVLRVDRMDRRFRNGCVRKSVFVNATNKAE